MKKVILLILVSILLLLAFTSCSKIKSIFVKDKGDNNDVDNNVNQPQECEHVWAEATCQVPKTCTICKVTEGAPSNHKTVPATCTTPQMCGVCGYTSSYWRPALGHDWKEASCLVIDPNEKAKPWTEQRGTPKTCRNCGLVDGEPIGHTLVEATCTEPAHCALCSAIDPDINGGKALGHNPVEIPYVAPTCSTKGSEGGEWCANCGEIYEEPKVLAALNHKGFEVLEFGAVEVTCTTDGMAPGEKCQGCGEIFLEPTVIPATGHRRELYDVDGNKIGEAELKGETYEGVECISSGTAYYECTICTQPISIVIPPKDHKYPAGASCDGDYECEYCHKKIEHEYADATCTEPATCKNCGLPDETRPALNHVGLMAPATCTAPSTCTKCGHTEGDLTSHKVVFGIYRGAVQYSCKTCTAVFSPTTDSCYLDGSNYENMHPINNSVTGYITATDDDGKPNNLPVIKTDDTGNRYYELIRDVRDPDLIPNDPDGKRYSPQIQLWVPMHRAGFDGFNLSNAAVGFFSFKMNAFMDRGMSMAFVEGSGWGETDAIQNFFTISTITEGDDIDPEDPDLGKKKEIYVTNLNGEKLKIIDVTGKVKPNTNPDTIEKKAFEIDDSYAVEEFFTGWFEVCIGIVLNINDTITLHYYIDGEYLGAVTKPLLTAGNGIKSVYISGNSDVAGSGIQLDDVSFGYLASGAWPYDTDHVHKFTEEYDRKDATCVNDGYIVYTCEECGLIGNKKVTPALGHQEVFVDAKEASCEEDGHNAYSHCSRCGIEVVKKEVIPGGHDYKVQGREPTCTSGASIRKTCQICGSVVTERLDPLGHEYSLSEDCDSGATCTRCGVEILTPIGHVMAPATCTAPSTCMREGCGHTEGDPLPHTMGPASCAAPSTCTMCNEYTEGEKLLHVLDYKYKDSKVVYFCPNCDASFTLQNGYYLSGYNYDGMTGTDKNKDFTVKEDTTLPEIVTGTDRYYQLLSNSDVSKQMELWIPKDDTGTGFGYSAATHSVGFLSFRINAKIVGDGSAITLQVIDGASNQGGNRWTANGVAAKLEFDSTDDGKMTFKVGSFNSVGFTHIFDVSGENGFTGWKDIAIGMVLDSGGDQITFHCYIDGVYEGSFSKTLTTTANAINCVYLSGNTTGKGTGVMLDDISFGYTSNATWVFDDCKHDQGRTKVVHMPTCTEDGYTESICKVSGCGYREITDIVPSFGGHIGGNATCTDKAKCIRKYVNDLGMTVTCGKEYGSDLGGHIGGVPTCDAHGVCTREYEKITYTDSKGNYTLGEDGKPVAISTEKVSCATKYIDPLGHIPGGATCANAPDGIRKEASCTRVIGTDENGNDIVCGTVIKGSYVECKGGEATCTTKATCEWCGTTYGDYAHKWQNALCEQTVTCALCGTVETYNVSHYPVPKLIDGKLAYACKYCGYTLILKNSYFHTADTPSANATNIYTVDEKNVYNSSSNNTADIVTDGEGEDANRYYSFVHDGTVTADRALEKAAIWTPKSGGTSGGFDTFTMANNMIGVFSIDLNVYVTNSLSMRFIDSDGRSGGSNQMGNFWADGALTGNFFSVSAPNSNNMVTLQGYSGTLATIEASNVDKYTGWFNLTVGLRFNSETKKLTLYYYINGEYISEASVSMNIITGKIDGVYITATSNEKGSGYMFDNIGFGCVKPNADGTVPIVPPFAEPETDPETDPVTE